MGDRLTEKCWSNAFWGRDYYDNFLTLRERLYVCRRGEFCGMPRVSVVREVEIRMRNIIVGARVQVILRDDDGDTFKWANNRPDYRGV